MVVSNDFQLHTFLKMLLITFTERHTTKSTAKREDTNHEAHQRSAWSFYNSVEGDLKTLNCLQKFRKTKLRFKKGIHYMVNGIICGS